MSKAYIVTSGEYSDYGIDAVFTDKPIADEYCKNFKCDEVEEYELNPSPIPLHFVQVVMMKNGDVHNIRHKISDRNISGFMWYSKTCVVDITNTAFNWNVQTTDEERAIKVVNEKRVQILVSNCWNDEARTTQLFYKD